ncbi:MAG: hypothetical protein AB1609_21885 [Bacillota bacterium]
MALRLESPYVEPLFNYSLAVLTFETARVTPVSGLSAGASAGGPVGGTVEEILSRVAGP